MTDAAAGRRPAAHGPLPMLVGLAGVLVLLIAAEAVIRLDWVSRFIVPPPSEVIGSLYRITA